MRVDQLSGDFENKATDEKDMYDFGSITQPKFNIVYAPMESLSLFANVGRSFQHPFGSSAYQAVDDDACRFYNDGWELGTQLHEP